MRASAPWGVLVALAAPAPTWALGLGDIELSSALNQPFQAKIDLTATAEELASLRVRVAPRETFERSGLDRPAFMSDFTFNITNDESGSPVITVTSRGNVAEPFVTMIIEATWSSGSIAREYTVFLDPPVLLPTPSLATNVRPAETGRTEQSPAATAPITRPAAPATRPAAPETRTAAPAPRPAPTAATGTGRAESYGPVQRAETLWQIAQRYQPPGVTMNQTMVAIYDANPEAFGGNMNVLRAGAILRIPAREGLTSLSDTSATAEFQRQLQAWRDQSGATDRLVLRPAADDGGALAGDGGGRATPAAGAGESARVASLEDEVASLRAELDENRRLLEVRDAELRDLQQQLSAAAVPAQTDVPVDAAATEPGVDLAPEEPIFADEPAGGEPVDAVDTPAPAEPPPAVQPAPSVRTVITAPPEPSLMSRVLGWLLSPIALILAGAAAVVVAGLWFMQRRREEPVAEDVTGQWDAIEAGMDQPNYPQPDLKGPPEAEHDPFLVEEQSQPTSTTLPIDDAEEIAADHYAQASAEASHDDTMSTGTVLNLDEADPVAEADFHMAYGLYDQAAELLTKELKENPDRRDLQLKLLEVFFVWGNKVEFLDAAQHLRSQMGDKPDSDWDKVLIMGKQIYPDAELFADAAPSAGGPVDVSFADDGSEGAIDFPFDDTGDAAVDLNIGEETLTLAAADSEATSVDLDLTGDRPGLPPEATATLDIGEATAAGLEAALFDSTSTEVDEESAFVERDLDEGATEVLPKQSIEEDEFDVENIWSDMSTEQSTVEAAAKPEDPTMETPSLDATQLQSTAIIEARPGDSETAIIDTSAPEHGDVPTAEQAGAGGAEYTAEIDVNDLGLDVDSLDDLPDDLDALAKELEDDDGSDTNPRPKLDVEADLLSATGITQVLQEQVGKSTVESNETTTVDEDSAYADTQLLGDSGANGGDQSGIFDLGDLSSALDDAETVQTPGAVGDTEIFGGVDLDIGVDEGGNEEPTGNEDIRGVEPQTMTEVGTKLDLARAYIDMGDPDGARGILEEVLAEGDTGQRKEAQSLIEAIGA